MNKCREDLLEGITDCPGRASVPGLWLRTCLFALIVPSVVLIVIPAALTALTLRCEMSLGVRLTGLVLLVPGLCTIACCFVAFVHRGQGTPAPYDPPTQLVVAGLYRYVRNPQYIGVVAVVIGEALLAATPMLSAYAAVLAGTYYCFVKYYEEPALRKQFGDAYIRYCESVPRWIPGRLAKQDQP